MPLYKGERRNDSKFYKKNDIFFMIEKSSRFC